MEQLRATKQRELNELDSRLAKLQFTVDSTDASDIPYPVPWTDGMVAPLLEPDAALVVAEKPGRSVDQSAGRSFTQWSVSFESFPPSDHCVADPWSHYPLWRLPFLSPSLNICHMCTSVDEKEDRRMQLGLPQTGLKEERRLCEEQRQARSALLH